MTTKPVPIYLTPEQRAVLDGLRGNEAISSYIKRLLQQAASSAGIDWPEHYGPGEYPRAPEYVFWPGDEQPQRGSRVSREWRDSDGTILRLEATHEQQRAGEALLPEDAEVVAFLEGAGYNGPGDWGLA